MKTYFDLSILIAIILGGWLCLYAGRYESSLNLFLAAAIILVLYDKK